MQVLVNMADRKELEVLEHDARAAATVCALPAST